MEKIKEWVEDEKERTRERDEEFKRRLKEEGGLNIDVAKDLKNWITKKVNLLFNRIVKMKPG